MAIRSPVLCGLAFSVFVSGCTSSGRSVDALDLSRPSMETTASVVPVPPRSVDEVLAAEPQPAVTGLAEEQERDFGTREFAYAGATPLPKARPLPVKPKAVARGTVYPPVFRDAKPVKFSVSPQRYSVHGVDVSRWQGDIDWVTLKRQGANFAYIKATDGGDHTDPLFMKNWKAAAAAGVPRGAYHFFYWCRNAESQAKWFIRNVPREAGALPPVIDVEWNHLSSCKKRPSRAVVLEKMRVFMDILERHYGQRPIIYTAPDFYRDNLKGQFTNHSFWLRAVAEHPSKVYPGRDWAFWQYSGTGLSKGVDHKIDLNVFNGDENSWRRWLGQRVHNGA